MNSVKLVSGTYSMDESVVERSYWALLGVMASSATFNHVFQKRAYLINVSSFSLTSHRHRHPITAATLSDQNDGLLSHHPR
ncbi:hypothetical protein Hdeb2414_s0015g00437531 [Helianthus debilis subsp. tardiflorus]